MGRSSATDTRKTRGRLIEAAGRAFRLHGFGGVGVDSVAKEAGVTSGAFYTHFSSKGQIFRTAVDQGLEQLRSGIEAARTAGGDNWLHRFATWYLGPERRADLALSCALPTLSLDAARADSETRVAYETQLRGIVRELTAGLAGTRREADAWAILALLAGGMMMAHAVRDPRLAARIARSIVTAIVAVAQSHTD
jgi:AcrR family transcriptional regulator